MKEKAIRKGFTLIEMLMVVAVIIILSGILFKITSLVTRNTGRAKALHDMQQLKNALEEYYSIYGMYPPCEGVGYHYEGEKMRKGALGYYLRLPAYSDPSSPEYKSDTQLGYKYGLVSYLWPREKGQWHKYNSDTERDKESKKKWENYLKDVQLGGGEQRNSIVLDRLIVFTNEISTIFDPWRNEYRYECKPPYTSYKLWSAGPDGADNTADDISIDSERWGRP